MSTSGNSGDDDTVSSTSAKEGKKKEDDARNKDVWDNVSDCSFSASDDNKDDDYAY